jgi:SNF2 family DNA or RNA helicase
VTDDDFYKKMLEGSGKMLLLDKFIDKYRQDGHKILLFSQFKGMTEILKDYMNFKKVRFEILTGSVKSQERAISI